MKIFRFATVHIKFTKFMSFLKARASFSSNFASSSLVSVMRDNSSVHFHLKLYMLSTKGTHQSASFQTFNCWYENLTKLLMSFFKPQVSFPLNFASPFSVMALNSSEIFLLKHYALDRKSPLKYKFSDFRVL